MLDSCCNYITKMKKQLTLISVVSFVLISAILAGIFKDVVNYAVTYKLLPMEEVVVITEEDTIQIPGEENDSNLYYEKLGWSTERSCLKEKYVENGKYISKYSIVVSPTQCIKVSIADTALTTVEYRSDSGLSGVYEISEQERAAGELRIYPFAASSKKVMWQIIIYVLMIAVLTFAFCAVHVHFLSEKRWLERFWKCEMRISFRFLCFTWFLLYLIALCQYVFHIGTPYYLPDNAVGDQGGYWETYIFKDGFFDFDYMALLATFRGYWNYMTVSIAKWVAARLGMDAVKIYLLFPTFTFSWASTWVIPQLFELGTKRRPKLVSVIIFTILNAYFWNIYLIGALGDYYCIALYLGFLLYLIKCIREKKWIYAGLAGLFFGIATNWRVSYWYESIGLFVLCVGVFCWEIRRETGILTFIKEKIKLLGPHVRRMVACLLAFLLCFGFVAAPQAVCNYKNNHLGIFPYDHEKAYGGYPVTWSGWNTFFFRGMVLWPAWISDDQLMTMKGQLYPEQWRELHPQQAMDVYANSPIEFMSCMIKKAFTIMDIKNNLNYGKEVWAKNLHGLLFSFMNYFVIFSGLYCLIKSKSITKGEKRFAWLFSIVTFLPSLQAHCEWRSGLSLYVVSYYFFSYHLIGENLAVNNEYKQVCDERFHRFLAVAMMFAFLESLTLWS